MPARKTVKKSVKKHTKASNAEISPEIKVLIVILLLLFFYPLGLIVMWLWFPEWPMWVKLLITLPILLGIIMLAMFLFFLAIAIKSGGEDAYREAMEKQYKYQHMKNWKTTVTPTNESNPTPVVLPSTDTY